ncbi:glycoside hydrolase family 3 C-terminal domain-containing protein [Lentzea sp.]|uniref:glycoside hydrolase family 3 C-terminal domain-containing protein n=1 Tax=Lentzea sp. TaxID=56099 RepID=UPI002B9697AD|nr:glycoside hydrolase family 3 C-terminal domain-containing protein [Lentzea sp.]HUQ58081.1 glycoside hydrolase family 3 C-terminal domain-containing protein [Lentzea sp.]
MPDDHELARLVGKLDLRAKVRLLAGGSVWRGSAEPAIGLRALTFSDGPAGVRGPGWDERRTSLALPSPTALAATWDEELVERLGGLLAAESRRKGVDVLLAPVLNLHRTPYGGRHFECFSEDPLLTARLGVAYVRGVQAGGVAAAPKHFVANETETDRLTHDVQVGERALRELYLAPFEAVVRAGAWAVMSAYNSVNGHSMSESPLLTTPLKDEWGFDGVVVSDWGAVRSTVASASSGQDLSMPGPWGPWGDLLVDAVEAGEVAETAVDEKVLRLLRLAARVGALDGLGTSLPARTADTALLREAVSASTVLLRNNGILPLGPADRIAVLGPGAASPRVQGGGSSGLYPAAESSLLSALSAVAEVEHAPGVRIDDRPTPVGAPVLVRVLGAGDEVLFREDRLTGRILETEEVPGAEVLEISTTLHVTTTGPWRLAVAGYGRLTLDAGGIRVIDVVQPVDTDDPAVKHLRPPHHVAEVLLTEGTEVELVARRDLGEDSGMASMLAADPPPSCPSEDLAAAVEAARRCDVAVVVVSTTDAIEGEGRDRHTLALPGEQDALVSAVCEANPNTVVVVNSGGPVLLPWREDAAAVLVTWFPGQEGGTGLADVLLGDREPGGRLPTTWPGREADVPVADFLPEAGSLSYREGLDIGYRAWAANRTAPAYWFGHGLGYTTWEYEEARVERDVVRVRLRNTGGRRGREVVQVYLSRPDSAVTRPERWLAGFATVTAEPGEAVEALVAVPERSISHWAGEWVVEPGAFTVLIGPNAGDTPLRLTSENALRPW